MKKALTEEEIKGMASSLKAKAMENYTKDQIKKMASSLGLTEEEMRQTIADQERKIEDLNRYELEISTICEKYGYKNMVEVFNHDHAQALMMITEIIDLSIENFRKGI